jgi:hypothetical protein
MAKKNSMYMNDYEILGFMVNKSTEQSKIDYLNYIQSLIVELQELKKYAENADNKLPLSMFFECQSLLVSFKNKLNAKNLSEWHMAVTYELQEEVKKWRENNK